MERPYPDDQHSVRLMCGDPIAIAYEWISAYVENLNSRIDEDDGSLITMDELIETAMSHVDSESSWGGDYLIRGGAFEGVDVDPMFWDKLSILKQITIPQKNRNSFLSCSC